MPIAKLPPQHTPGTELKSAEYNAAIAACWNKASVRGGPGIKVTMNDGDGAVVSLAVLMQVPWMKPARITKVYGMEGSRQGDVRYDWQIYGEGETASRTYVSPKYGRMFDDRAAIKPAQIGDLCYVIQLTEDNGDVTEDMGVWPGTERILARECASDEPPANEPIPVIGPDGNPIQPGTPPTDGGPVGGVGGQPSIDPAPPTEA